jgi:hypothetical protein
MADKGKHTPGPWTCKREYDGYAEVDGPLNSRGQWYDFAKVVTIVEGKESAEGRANLNLILAAPDLLAALRELVGQRDAHFHTASAWDAARAAIAKAEGEIK